MCNVRSLIQIQFLSAPVGTSDVGSRSQQRLINQREGLKRYEAPQHLDVT